jgi:CRISPR-associated protein Cmr5
MNTIKPRQTTEQRRAAHAWNKVRWVLAQWPHRIDAGKRVPDRKAKEYSRVVQDLPTRILASGLGQALAFRWAKRKGPEDESTLALLRHVGDWVLDKRKNPTSTAPEPDPQALISRLVADDANFLRFATEEAIAYLQWLKRFAEAEELTEGDNV